MGISLSQKQGKSKANGMKSKGHTSQSERTFTRLRLNSFSTDMHIVSIMDRNVIMIGEQNETTENPALVTIRRFKGTTQFSDS